jgi:hypothetical protein
LIAGQSHIHLQPILNLRLRKGSGEELSIDDVLFVSHEKLRRVRRRIGLPWRVSDAPRDVKLLLAGVETLGIVATSSSSPDASRIAATKGREACSILRAVSWPFAKRSRSNLLRVFGPSDVAYRVLVRQLVIEKSTGHLTGTRTGQQRALVPFQIDHNWKGFQKRHGWLKALVTFFEGGQRVDAKWRSAVRRAAILFGESLQEADRSLAFLFNMMALDTILREREERSREVFPRLDAILGWSNVGLKKPWFASNDLKRLADRRNELVHEGESPHLSADDLVLADELLGNLLLFVCEMGDRWPSRKEMIRFAERVSCRKKLLLKPYEKEGKLPFKVLRPRYQKAEIIEL